MRDIPKPNEIYKHFKGNRYKIICIARDAGEAEKSYVIYQALYGEEAIYARELYEFLSPVDRDKYPDVPSEFRFEKEGAPDTPAAKAESIPAAQPAALTATNVPVAAETPEDDASADPDDEAGFVLDPEVERFLDAKEPEDKLTILTGMHNRITDEMLTVMAVSTDFELNEGSVEEKYNEFRKALIMKAEFEKSRLRI